MQITFEAGEKTAQPEKRCIVLLKQCWFVFKIFTRSNQILSSIVVSIPACHAGDRGSISLRAELFSLYFLAFYLSKRMKPNINWK